MTPRTDAVAFDCPDLGRGRYAVPADFARQLERELAARSLLAEKLAEALKEIRDYELTGRSQEDAQRLKAKALIALAADQPREGGGKKP